MDTVPVMTGYLFLGFGFGLLMQQMGFGVWWSAAVSFFIYAGSMQYVAVGLLPDGAGRITTALTTLFVTIFTEQWLSTKDHVPALVGVGCTALCLFVFGKDVLLTSPMALISGVLVLIRRLCHE